jgi:hypothetical protein
MFILLIGLQIFLDYSNNNILEGLNTYIEYDINDNNDALSLSKQNESNIQLLKQQFGALQTQLDSLVQAQQDYINNITSSNSELTTSYDESSSSDNTNYI